MAMAIPSYMLLLFYLVLHARMVVARENQSPFISLGSSLSPITPPSSWHSSSGKFAFGFYPQDDGFSVGIWLVGDPENTVAWTANRDDPPIPSNATLELTTDGKLLVRTAPGDEILIANVSDPADSALMLDSGNFVLYGKNKSVVIWQSFDFPTDTLLGGQNLTSDANLISGKSKSNHSSGRFLLGMQVDGNLVAYPLNSSYAPEDAYWSFSSAFRSYDVLLSLDHHGNLFVSKGYSMIKLVNNSYTRDEKPVIYRLTLDADGILRLYAHHLENNSSSKLSTEWVGLQDQCAVKGFCSFNSYCSSSGGKGECYCYPGFNWTSQSDKWLGCSINIAEDACREDQKFDYNMTAMENTWWSDYPYSVVPMTKEYYCSRSCQEDCNCGAVLFANENCQKFKLPLRYGRRNRNNSAVAFFKVFLERSETSQVEIVIEGKESLVMIIAISLGSVAFLCFSIAVSSFFMYRYQVHDYRNLSTTENLGLSEEFALRSFSYTELEKVTNNFSEELGRGSFGAVYRGMLNGGTKAIAVKRLEKIVEEGEREFRAEICAIGRTYHRNLVQLLGFCVENSRRLLVYEYLKNGSLADILFKAQVRPVWRERIRIALDVARGIFYLHEECRVHIVHCNIKPRNILIDDSWTAKISDFGLAKLLIPNQTSIAQMVIERSGYSAPELQSSALISVKADIYSYGIVLLEIICCRSNIEVNVNERDETLLSSWAYKCLTTGEVYKLVEDEDVDMETLERMVKVALWCIQNDPTLRPAMKDVMLMLEGIMEVQVPPYPAFSTTI
ncbi:G-type lectin S-receptor-like serine/threonine-protein kinase LECRK1 [Mercurialis annua]|uniref:G-type lectin S-receptor-like serine/threonine-protein kinase LECRK1 n=1 Tax=Mercurialis annua TaxID=3986 RepID=UPI00215E437A|nr:G-type lectin S-receptor-like serine/threonine-protein kinase LECRK1 [Mercurialis annua]